MLKSLFVLLIALAVLNVDTAIAQQDDDAISSAQKVLTRMNETIASTRHKAILELLSLIKKENQEGREENANIIRHKLNDLKVLATIDKESTYISEAELPKNTWQKHACIANMKQIQGAFEQAELAGIKKPTLNDIIGPNSYIRKMPTCPTTKAPYTEINPPECPSKVPSHVLP